MLRIELANGDAQPRASLQHPHPGGSQGKILLVGELDQPRQSRVIERRPPIPVLRGGEVHGFVALLKPFIGNPRWRGFEIWTQQTSLEEQRQPEEDDAFRFP